MILQSTMPRRPEGIRGIPGMPGMPGMPGGRQGAGRDASREWLLMIDIHTAEGSRRCRAGIEACELAKDPGLHGFARALRSGRQAEAMLESGRLGLQARSEAIHAMQRAQEACQQLAGAKLGEHLDKAVEPWLALGFHGMREARAAGMSEGRLGCGIRLARAGHESLPRLMQALDSIFGPGAWFTHARGSAPQHCFDGPEGMAWLASRMERLGLEAASGLDLPPLGDHRRLRL